MKLLLRSRSLRRYRAVTILVLALLVAPLASLAQQLDAKIDAAVEAHLPAAITDVQQWVRYRTVTDATDSYRAEKTALLKAIVTRAAELGLSGRLVAEDRVAIVDLGDVADPDNAIGILVHADVVPANADAGWDAPPFSGELIGDRIYGRGAADDKGPIAATLHAMAIIRELELPLDRGVRMIVGTSEENMQWDDMAAVAEAGWVPATGWTADAAFPVINAEKSFLNATVIFRGASGAGILSGLQGGLAPNSVPDRAQLQVVAPPELRARLTRAGQELLEVAPGLEVDMLEAPGGYTLVVTGKAAHGSRPESGLNAITHLAALLEQSGVLESAGRFPEATALRFIRAALGLESDGERLGIARSHDVMGATTVNLGMVESRKDAVLLSFNIRGPDGLSVEEITAALEEAAAPFSGEVVLEVAKQPLYVDPDTLLVRTLQASYAAITGEEPKLLAIGGTTYAKAYPGYVAFGMGFIGEAGPVHAPNERLLVSHLQRGMRIYVDAILRASRAEGR